MTEYVTVRSSELSAMMDRMDQMHKKVDELASQKNQMPAPPMLDENGSRPLTEKEREYIISMPDVISILGVSERTCYRKIDEFNIPSTGEGKKSKFVLGIFLDIISKHGLSYHAKSLNRLLAKREIRYYPCRI